MNRNLVGSIYGRSSIKIDQVSVNFAKGFQRRLKCEKLTDDGCQVMVKAHIALGKGKVS
jgi:hypothetical protein